MFRDTLRRTGFRRQITVIATVAILGLALFSSLMNSLEGSRRMRGYIVEQGQRIAENLARQSILALLYHSPDNAREGVAVTLAFPDVHQVEIVDMNHHVVLSQGKSGSSLPLPFLGISHNAVIKQAMLEKETDEQWTFGAPVYGGQTEDPFDLQEHRPQLLGYVHVAIGKGTLHHLVNSLLVVNLAITLSFAIILLGLMRFLVGRMTVPLNALSNLMRRAEAGESGLRAIPDGPRDISSMSIGFNKMMTVLEERELELKQSRDAAIRAALTKSQFATTVSHEVRTPLNGVIGMLDMLKEMRLTKPQQECVDVAWNSSHALLELINDILDFSKMEAGKLQLEEIDFSLHKLTEEVIELLAKSTQQKGLDIGYLMSLGIPDRIKGDSLRLRQVLINLVGNAVKFTKQGEVSIRISRSDINDHFALRFDISDTGIGITDEAMQYLFESFSQADRSTTREYGGTGLGLAICRQLVELMGGEIGVSSRFGQGTTFWFTIQCKLGELTPTMLVDNSIQGLRVLVVEDSNVVRAFIEQNLNRHGMHSQAVPGFEVMAELNRAKQGHTPFDLVIMDIAATDEQGAELAHRIRSDMPFSPPRILFLDRQNLPSNANLAAKEAILKKPLRLDRLLESVRQVMSGKNKHVATAIIHPLRPPVQNRTKIYRVLVAEDNRTNQMVAGGMLTMNGCHCEFAANGREAIEVARHRRFDIIFMDCNMPEMDGYEATAHIRNFEEPLGLRTPIIALTANTQRGDAEKCLSAGMDDYLAKPITLVELRHKLERWLKQDPSTPKLEGQHGEVASGPLDQTVFNKLRDILGSALQQAVLPFLEDTPGYLRQLELAISRNDVETVRIMAHSIKGSSGNLGAITLAHLAKEVEDLALEQRIEEIRPLVSGLRAAFEEVEIALDAEVYIEDRQNNHPEEELPLVLVVEDDRSTRNVLRHTLQREGFRVEEAEDGAQALGMLKRILPDVILMDAMMPVMDGFTACAKLQELPHGRIIPVLMITALEDNLSVEKAFAAGASDYIPKPIHFAVLSQRVRRIIDGNRAEKRIRHIAYNDLLTGLPNRALFIEQLGLSIEQARQAGDALAVMFLDLDRFKYINDTLGHDIGDHLLVAVAQRLRRCVRTVDSVARLGGDEFTVVLSNIDAPRAAITAQHICHALATPFEIDGHDIFVTASVGISLYPHDGIDVNTLLKHADTAMYRAKKTKTSFQFFEPAMERSIAEHVHLQNDLRHAIERHELEIYYQPQVCLNNGQVIGMEALLRWHHPSRGMVSPIEFIPLAEESGLIHELGEWVLRTACAQVQQWVQDGLPSLKIAVNLSVRQLLQKDFSLIVEKALADTGLTPQLLELEITEGTLMEHAQDTLEALHRLRSLGIRLSIDDFGTGYSSLAYLKRFPVDIVKIDRSFVRDVCEDADDAAIVTGIIALAHSLRLEVVAEGVETESQLQFLREKSCDLIQGYYLSVPIPADQFARFITTKAHLQLKGIGAPNIR